MKLFVFLFLLVSSQAFANYQILQMADLNSEVGLFLDNGEIVEISKSNEELLELAQEAYEKEWKIEINKISHNDESPDIVSNIVIIPREIVSDLNDSPRFSQDPSLDALDGANMTRFDTYDQAQALMDTFNGNTDDDSQCYNRAHMWTYEAAVLERSNLGKVWIFFTRKYIREYRYKWWFHVAPYGLVNDGNEKYVLDRGFTMVPFNMTNWKNLFMKNEANCPVVQDYRHYENNQRSQYCYLMYSSQFYWQPQHLERLATRGQTQGRYNESDLRITYRDALRRRWNGRIPRLGAQPVPAPRPEPRPDRPAPRPRPEPRPDRPDRPEPRPDRPAPRPDRPVSTVQVGEWVISSNGVDGQVTRVLNPIQVEVKYTTERHAIVQHINDLAVRRGSSRGFYVGQRIYSSNYVRGVITGVYRDGHLAVQYETVAGHMKQHPSQLIRR